MALVGGNGFLRELVVQFDLEKQYLITGRLLQSIFERLQLTVLDVASSFLYKTLSYATISFPNLDVKLSTIRLIVQD